MSSLFKDKYYEYDAYHSSLDNLELVNGEQINETFELYKKIINKLEKLVFLKVKICFVNQCFQSMIFIQRLRFFNT